MSWNKWLYAALAALTLNLPSLNADCGDTCEPCVSMCDLLDPCDGLSVYGDWLFWRPRRCELNYAISYEPDANPEYYGVHSVCPKYDSGYRVGVLKACGDLEISVQYTNFGSNVSGHVFNEITDDERFILTQLSNDERLALLENHYAEGKYDLDLQMIDAEIGYYVDLNRCWEMRYFGGLKFLFLDQTFDTLGAFNPDNLDPESLLSIIDKTHQSVNMDAYGIYLGTEGRYNWTDRFSLLGNLSYAILIGDVDRHYRSYSKALVSDEFVIEDSFSDSCWRMINNFNLVMGMEWHICDTYCLTLDLQAGYEFHYYLNTMDFMAFTTDGGANGHFDRHTEDISFDGLYIRVIGTF